MVNDVYWMVCKGDTPIGTNRYKSYFVAVSARNNAQKVWGDDTLSVKCFQDTEESTVVSNKQSQEVVG